MDKQKLSSNLNDALPPIFGRSAVDSLLPGIISSKRLANLHASGESSPPFFRRKRRIFYVRESFVAWLLDEANYFDSMGRQT